MTVMVSDSEMLYGDVPHPLSRKDQPVPSILLLMLTHSWFGEYPNLEDQEKFQEPWGTPCPPAPSLRAGRHWETAANHLVDHKVLVFPSLSFSNPTISCN